MKRRQTLEYNWELGTEKIALEVAEYMHGSGLYIGMLSKEGRVWESFGDLTVNLPFAPAEAQAWQSASGNSKLRILRFSEGGI